jgi:four helix bundle protein
MEKPHKKLDVWNAAVELTSAIYRMAKGFPREERFTLVDQLHRAALSVPSNIAEGAARQTKKEFVNFLHMAQGSLSEMDTQLEIAKRLGYLTKEQWEQLDEHIARIDKMLSGLIRSLKSQKS